MDDEFLDASDVGEQFSLKDLSRTINESITNALNKGGILKLAPYEGEVSFKANTFIEDYEERARAKNWKETHMLERFGMYLEGTAKSWYKLITKASDNPPENWAEMKAIFLKQFLPSDSKRYFRDHVLRRKQGTKESVTQYIVEKRLLCFQMDPDMSMTDIMDYVFDGFLPEIKREIEIHGCDNLQQLSDKAAAVEKGIKHFSIENRGELDAKSADVQNRVVYDCLKEFGNRIEEGFKSLKEEKIKIPNRNQNQNQGKQEKINPRYDPRYIQNINQVPRYSPPYDNRGYGNRNNFYGPPRNFRNDRPYFYNNGDFAPRGRTYYPYYSSQESSDQMNPRYDYQRFNMRGRFPPPHYGYNNQFQNRGYINGGNHPYNDAMYIQHPERVGMIESSESEQRSSGQVISTNSDNSAAGTREKKVSFEEARELSDNRNSNAKNRCHLCGQLGHYIRFCPNNPSAPSNCNLTYNEFAYVNNIKFSNLQSDNLIYVKLNVNDREVICLVDTGSEVSIIDERLCLSLDCDITEYNGPVLRAANDTKVNILGKTFIDIRLPGTTEVILLTPTVLRGFRHQLLLGNDFNSKAGITINCKDKSINFTNKTKDLRVNLIQPVVAYLEKYQHESLHSNKNVTLIPNNPVEVKVSISNKRKSPRFFGLVFTDREIYNLKSLSIDSIPTNFEKGTCIVRLTNRGYKPREIKIGEKIGRVLKHKEYRIDNVRKPPKIIEYEISDDTLKSMNNLFMKINEIHVEKEPRHLSYDSAELMKSKIDSNEIVINRNLNSIQKEEINSILIEFSDVFAFDSRNIGNCRILEHTIDTGDNPPVNAHPYRASRSQKDFIEKQIIEWLEMGIIVPIHSEYSSPVVIVPKKEIDPETGRNAQRLCIDYRSLNRIMKSDHYPLPRIDDILSMLSHCEYYTPLDCNQGYLQIFITDNDIRKTAFITHQGLHAFLKMPFGLKNAPATFQRCVDRILGESKYKCAIGYLDDILVYSKTFEEHKQHLRTILSKVRDSGLTLKPSKCCFAMNSIIYLGHLINKEGIKMDPERVKAIKQFPIPQNLTQVRSFLGLAGYHRQFVKDWSKIAEPLSRLTKKSVNYYWGPDQDKAFNKIKDIMTTEPLLIHFDPERETQLKTDACGYAIAAILEQKVDGKFKPVTYISRMMTDTEQRNFCISEKECLAIVYATNKLKPYLDGIKFKVITDHSALKWLKSKKDLSQRLILWGLHLQKFDFEVEYKSGKKHKDCDALSRNPVDPPSSEEDNMTYYSFIASREPIKFSKESLAEMQRQDPIFGKIHRAVSLNENITEEYEQYSLVGELLYYSCEIKGRDKLLFCLPVELLFETIYSYHDDSYGGHLGFDKTYEKLRNRFHFPNLMTITELYCQSCVDCATGTSQTVSKSGLMIPINTEGPAQVFALDWLGPFMESLSGNRWILVGTDLFTKWAIAKAYKLDQSEQVVDFYLNNIVCNFGVPRLILTDRGRQFISKISKGIFNAMGSCTVTTTAYHPQCNGQTERFNKTLSQMLKKFITKDCKAWDQGLSQLVFGYNSSVHKTTGYTPFYLCHGYEPYLPADSNLKVIRDSFPIIDDFVDNLTQNLHKAWKIAFQNIKKCGTYNKSMYDEKRREMIFSVGDTVWCHYPKRIVGTSSKLIHQYRGPYEIIEKTSPVNYKIRSLKGKETLDKVHVSRLKRCVPRQKFFDFIEKLVDKHTPLQNVSSTSSDESEIEITQEIEEVDSQATEIDELNDIFDTDSSKDETPVLRPKIIELDFDQMSDEEEVVATPLRQTNLPSIEQNQTKDQTQNPTPATRRSVRTKRKPDYYVALLVLLLIYILLPTAGAAFQKSNPILWYRSPKLVVTGANRVLINIRYNSPCEIFKQEPLKNWQSEQLFTLCDTHFKNDFISPIRDFCNTPEEISSKEVLLKRNKRLALITMGIIALVSIVISTTVGVSSAAISHSSKANQKIEFLEQQQSELLDQLEQLQTNQMKIKDILTELQKEIKNIGTAMKSVTEAVNLLNHNLPRTIYYLTTIISRFTMVKDRLKDVGRDFKLRKINPKLLDIFNFTLPCGENCDIRTAEPISCKIDILRQTITLIFDIQITKPRSHIMLADAFTLIERPNNSSILCENVYVGPNSVIYSQDNDCVTTLPTNQQSYLNLVLASDDPSCRSPLPHNLTVKFWKGSQCENRHLVTIQDIVQIKQIAGSNYIYCKSFNIRVYDRYLLCPDFVFILSTSVSFSIGDLKFEANNRTIDISTEFIPHYSDRINFFLMPDLHDFSFDKINRNAIDGINNLTITNTKINRHFPEINTFNGTTIVFLVIFFSVCLFLILYYLCRRQCPSKGRRRTANFVRTTGFTYSKQREQDQGVDEVDSDIEEITVAPRPSQRTRPPATCPSLMSITTTLLFMITVCEGVESLTFDIKFYNPCYNTPKFKFATNEVVWCEDMFEQTIKSPLHGICAKTKNDSVIKFILFDSPETRLLEKFSKENKDLVPKLIEYTRMNDTEPIQIQFRVFNKFKELKEKILQLKDEFLSGTITDATINYFQYPFLYNISTRDYRTEYCSYNEQDNRIVFRLLKNGKGKMFPHKENYCRIISMIFLIIAMFSYSIITICFVCIFFKINKIKLRNDKCKTQGEEKVIKKSFDTFLV